MWTKKEFRRYSEKIPQTSRMLFDKQSKETEHSVPTGATLFCWGGAPTKVRGDIRLLPKTGARGQSIPPKCSKLMHSLWFVLKTGLTYYKELHILKQSLINKLILQLTQMTFSIPYKNKIL